MQAYEVWDSQVAVFSAPASPRKSGATVRRTHGMRPHDRHSLSGVGGGQLSRGRARHETRDKSTDDRDDHPESKGPSHRRVFKILPPECYSHGYADEGLCQAPDRRAHDNRMEKVSTEECSLVLEAPGALFARFRTRLVQTNALSKNLLLVGSRTLWRLLPLRDAHRRCFGIEFLAP